MTLVRRDLRILIVAENVSMAMGGEASRPLYCFRLLRQFGIDTTVVCHSRVREELRKTLDDNDFRRVMFVEDTILQKLLWYSGRVLPYRIRDLVVSQFIHVLTQHAARRIAKRIVRENDIDIVYEPSPNSPKTLSFMYRLGAPVVIGPLCGGLEFPPAFRDMDSSLSSVAVALVRFLSRVGHGLFPGKTEARSLIVADRRTAEALPKGCRGRIYEIIESGVDLEVWTARDRPEDRAEARPRFVYAGRFVDWKGVEFLVQAFARIQADCQADLELIGSGELYETIEGQVRELGLESRVRLHGWLSRPDSASVIRQCDVFVMPSLRECGGTALLEAMALGLPVISIDWAGPGKIVDVSNGILVRPTSREDLVDGLASAMMRLGKSSELRKRMGDAGRRRVRTQFFDWNSKVSRVLEILGETLEDSLAPSRRAAPRFASRPARQRTDALTGDRPRQPTP